jgi:hypothetical protein
MVLTSGMVFVQRGRPAKDHRTIVNVILWVLRTGAFRCDCPSASESETTGDTAASLSTSANARGTGVRVPQSFCGLPGDER